MPIEWKALTKTGDKFHRARLVSNDNYPRTYCQQAHVESLHRTPYGDTTRPDLCDKCDWVTNGETTR